jgi:1-acyl-sn-glycerol-3-phosphate acyltransferase
MMTEKKLILRTILFFFWMWIVLFFSILLLIPLGIFDLFHWKRTRKNYTLRVTGIWSRHLIHSSGSTILLSGQEHIPQNRGFCLIANHQSNFDIPLILSSIPENIGFIGKSEMLRIPFLRTWMKALNCVFIKRDDLGHSIRGIKKALEQVKKGYSMVLFPEGTRSRQANPGVFHEAGIRLAIKNGIPILPVSICNSHKMFESTGRITPTEVKIIIHPLKIYEKKNMDKSVSVLIKQIGDAISTHNEITIEKG